MDDTTPRATETATSKAAPSAEQLKSEQIDANSRNSAGIPSGIPGDGLQIEGEEEEETCGFCIFMKGGGCKDEFNEWSACVDKERESGGDFTEECKEKTFALRDCMLKNKTYYAPVLEEEDAFAEEKEGGETGSKEPDSDEPRSGRITP